MLEREARVLNVAADLVILGKRRFEGAMGSWPFFPDIQGIERMGDKLWQDTEFGALTGPERINIAGAWGKVVGRMAERARLQRQEKATGEIRVRNNHQKILNELTEGKIDLNPANFRISWGLLCMSLVVKQDDYRDIGDIFGGKRLVGTTGFVNPDFSNELGPIVVVRRGDEMRKTIKHEDAHVLSMLLGTIGEKQQYLIGEVLTDHFQRVIMEGKPREGDAALCLKSVRKMRKGAKQAVGDEFQAILWERRLPDYAILRDELITKPMEIGVLATVTAAYQSSLTDREKVNTVFEAVKCGDDINCYFYNLKALVAQATENYRGRFNKWDWVASRMIVMPAGLPVNAYAKVLGADLKKINPEYTGNPAGSLAEALATHAVMKMGLEEGIPQEREAEYISQAEELLKNKPLYAKVQAEYEITQEKLASELERKVKGKISLTADTGKID